MRTRSGYRITIFHIVAALVFVSYGFSEVPTRLTVGGVSANAVLTLGLSAGLIAALLLVPMMSRARLPASVWLVTAWFLLSYAVVGDGFEERGTQQIAVWVCFVLTLQLAAAVAHHPRRRYLEVPLMWAALAWFAVLVAAVPARFADIATTALGNRPTAAMVAIIAAIFIARSFARGRHQDVLLATGLAFAVAGSGSRTATAAILVAFLAVALARLGVPSLGSFLRLVLVLGLAVGGSWVFLAVTPAGDRVSALVASWDSVIGDPFGGTAVTLTQGRSRAWVELVDRGLDRPLIGHGIGSAQAEAFAITQNLRFTHPHNEFIRVFFETGAVGVTLFSAAVVQMFASVMRSRRSNPSYATASDAAIGALSAATALMLTDNVLVYSFVMVPLAVIVGLGIGPRHSQRTAAAITPEHVTAPPRLGLHQRS